MAILAMALLSGRDGWVLTAAFLAIYAFVAFVPMTVDLLSADMAGQKPERSAEERRSTSTIGLLGLSAIVVSACFDAPVITLGLCLLFTVMTMAVYFCRFLTGNRDSVAAVPAPAAATAPSDDAVGHNVPAPVPASAHHGLSRAGW